MELVMQKLNQSNDVGERLVRHFAAFGLICISFLIGRQLANLFLIFQAYYKSKK